MTEKKLIAVVRVRGVQGVRWRVKKLLAHFFRLTRRNHLVLLPYSPSLAGALKECKDYIAWGEVSADTLVKLGYKPGDKKVYRLHPARKGFGSLKRAFPKGALGKHGDKINSLIERMLTVKKSG